MTSVSIEQLPTSFAADLEQLGHAIAPRDLDGLPIYIGLTSELPPEFAAESMGYTCPSLHSALRGVLPDRGPGPAVVLDDLRAGADTRKMLPGIGDAKLRRYVADTLTGTFLHELAHVLETDEPFSLTPRDQLFGIAFREALAAHHVKERRQVAATGRPIAPDLVMHGLTFTRIALHVLNRAARLGIAVPPAEVCASIRYVMSDAQRYESCLWPELEQLADAPFAEIRRAPAPYFFQALYDADVRRRVERETLFPVPC